MCFTELLKEKLSGFTVITLILSAVEISLVCRDDGQSYTVYFTMKVCNEISSGLLRNNLFVLFNMTGQ